MKKPESLLLKIPACFGVRIGAGRLLKADSLHTADWMIYVYLYLASSYFNEKTVIYIA